MAKGRKNGNGGRGQQTPQERRIQNSRKYHDQNPVKSLSSEAQPRFYKGRRYDSTTEAEWAKILTEVYGVEFDIHVKFECHNRLAMMKKEVDFTHPPILLPDGEWCNASEVKGVLTLDALVRNNAIRFSHPGIVCHFIFYELIRYIQRWGKDGEKKPKYEHSRSWTPEREIAFLALTAGLFNGYGVEFTKTKTFMSYDVGGVDSPPQLRPFVVDLLFVYPQKLRGISHEVDGIIVRLEPQPDDYLLVRSLKRYHGLDIAIVHRSYFKFWQQYDMFAENRKNRLRFGRRRKPRKEGSEYLPINFPGIEGDEGNKK